MKKQDDIVTDCNLEGNNCGLTKLEYFTAKAMQGMLANYKPGDFSGGFGQMTAAIAIDSVKIAKEVIAEINK